MDETTDQTIRISSLIITVKLTAPWNCSDRFFSVLIEKIE